MAGRPLPAPLRLLLGGQYGVFMAGNSLSLIGTWMQRVGCSWLVWDWTGSALWVGALAAADLLPVVIVGPVAGVAADRWDRLRQNRLAQAASALLAAGLAVLLLLGRLNLPLLLVLVAAQGTLIAAVQPARLAMVQQMVARADVGVAVALNSVSVNLARLIGPAVAGLLIVQGGVIYIFLLNALVTLMFVLVLGRIRLAPRDGKSAPAGILAQMKGGFVYVWNEAALRMMLLMLLLGGVLARSVVELVPAVAAATFADAMLGLSALTSAAAAGAVIAGLTVRETPIERLLPRVTLWWSLAAIAAVAMVRAPHPAIAIASSVLVGGSITRGLVSAQTFVQLSTPDALRGRVLSVHGLVARGSPAIGALLIGYAADRIGLVPSVTMASAMLLACMLAMRARVGAGGG